MTSLIERIKKLAERWRRSRPGRALERFGAGGGSVLSGGIAYTALFSLFALLTIMFTVLLGVLGGNHELLDAVTKSVNAWIPGLLKEPGGEGLIDPQALMLAPALSLAGIVSVVVLAWSGLAFARGLRAALDAIGERSPAATSFIRGLARDLGLVTVLGLSLLATSALQLLAWEAGPALDGLADGWRWAATIGLRAASFLLAAAADAAVITYLLWPFTREPEADDDAADTTNDGAGKHGAGAGAADAGRQVSEPAAAGAPASAGTAALLDTPATAARKDVLRTAAIAGLSFGIVRLVGVSVVTGSSAANPLLAPFAAIITLLAWVNLNSRIVLLAAAWVTTPVPALSGGDTPGEGTESAGTTQPSPR